MSRTSYSNIHLLQSYLGVDQDVERVARPSRDQQSKFWLFWLQKAIFVNESQHFHRAIVSFVDKG